MNDDDKLSKDIFALAAPVLPVLLDQLGELDPEIVGGFLLCFRADGSICCLTGNMPPSATIPVLKSAIESLAGDDAQLVELAFADMRSKSN